MNHRAKNAMFRLLAATAAMLAATAACADGPPVGSRILPPVRVDGAVAEHGEAAREAPMPADLKELPDVDADGRELARHAEPASLRQESERQSQ